MTDAKTTPAPAALHPEQRAFLERQISAVYARESVRALQELRSLSGFLAQLRAADARSARRFEGL
jgi:hypothetical protein